MTARLLKITHLLPLVVAVVFSAEASTRAAQSSCEEFSRAVKSTYNFKPSRLKDEAERSAKSPPQVHLGGESARDGILRQLHEDTFDLRVARGDCEVG
jgi:hypothetical protein